MIFMRLFFVVLSLTAMTFHPASADDLVYRGKPAEYEDYGYLVRGAAWVFEAGAEKVIFVCWENADSSNKKERGWIQDQIARTWQANSQVQFKGWQQCGPKNNGIRVVFKDAGPHVEKFGKHLNGLPNGMVLNNDFNKWGEDCKEMREACIRSIAAHEFGHALGFAHEQNRPDTPGECSLVHGQGQPNEEPLTPYDADSVMNYCNPKYNNDGQLSALDIKALQAVYGK